MLRLGMKMGAELHAFESVSEVQPAGITVAASDGRVLPEVPRRLLSRIFQHLNADDRAAALQQRYLPVAWLPHATLYADALPRCHGRAGPSEGPVVAKVNAEDFNAGIKAFWARDLLRGATLELARRMPRFSARRRLTGGQAASCIALAAALVAGGRFLPGQWLYAILSLGFSALFVSTIELRLMALLETPEPPPASTAISDEELPIYSVLVPVFMEESVLGQLVVALRALDYPRDKLDIKLIIEETDTAMRRALSRLRLPSHFELVIVPAGKPQTKPKALNYALQFARGTLLTIFDAEDIPEPQQLKLAASAFAVLPESTACLQAELTFYNPGENWLTRQFTVEYATLFGLVLPMLAKLRLPLPLGGTSNHFRTSALRAAGGWDPFNVTEDADLGFRLARFGYEVSVLDSLTYEEANMDLANWLHQRTRWLKGFLQTWLVHMRNPLRVYNELGPSGFWVLQASTLGVFASATLHPLFFGVTMLWLYDGAFSHPDTGVTQMAMSGAFLAITLLGAGIAILCGYRALKRKGIIGWTTTLATLPAYWLLMSLAGWMALWQFAAKPFHWNKTRHGLSQLNAE